jgi:hypothetical protein
MKIVATAAFAAAAALALTASAQPPPTQPSSAPPPPKPRAACFWTNRIENFAAVDSDNLYLRVGQSDVYRAELFASCLDLDSVHHLALVSRSSSIICEGGNLDTTVVTRDHAVGPQHCPVLKLTRLTPDQVAALPRGARP